MIGTTFVKPDWAPALPIEARTMREADGSSGNRSLLVLTLVVDRDRRGVLDDLLRQVQPRRGD